jgi:hypothetical protein
MNSRLNPMLSAPEMPKACAVGQGRRLVRALQALQRAVIFRGRPAAPRPHRRETRAGG